MAKHCYTQSRMCCEAKMNIPIYLTVEAVELSREKAWRREISFV